MRLGHRARWTFNLYPEAGEGGGCFVPTLRAEPTPGCAADPERSQQEAARRARGKLRRYCAANRLSRFVTLTYAGAGCFDPQQLRSDVAEFFRGLRRELGRQTASVRVGVRVASRRARAARAFRGGPLRAPAADSRRLGARHRPHQLIGDLPVGSGALEEARRAASYLAKYVSKNIGDERVPKLHRYEVAQGFQPLKVPLSGESDSAVIEQASERMGGPPARVWRSSEQEGWRAPPAYWCAWTG